MTFAPLNRLAYLASQRSDVVIAAFLMLAVVMMIIPLPTLMVDALIAVNIAFSLLVLIVAFYVSRSVDFSALPPIILLSTLLRLSLSITTTRLILLQGDAGEIVAAFGEFVIAGEVVIGLVVFLIITVAQFLVITKGAERVAEVAARFTLDAMPGKQMSIDNDLRNGDIDPQQAKRKRNLLERESQLYGAMDGAMKFVKGDAIASLVILFVNLLGGMAIGMAKRGLSFSEASHTYSLLTVGDGLIAQIPALLIAVAAGIVVTRVASDNDQDLGSEIVGQLGSNQRALTLTAIILLGVAFIPGFPAPVFVVIAAILGSGAYAVHRRTLQARPAPAAPAPALATPLQGEPAAPVDAEDAGPERRIMLLVGAALGQRVSLTDLREQAEDARQAVMQRLGIELPEVGVRPEGELGADQFAVLLEGVPISSGPVPSEHLLLRDDPLHLQLLDIEPHQGMALGEAREALWIEALHRPALEQAGIGFRDVEQALGEHLRSVLQRYAADFIGIQETRRLLDRVETDYPELVRETLRHTSVQRLADILRRLLDEGIALRNVRGLLEALVEWGPRDLELHVLSEHARSALSRQICHQYADAHRVIAAFVLARPLEDALRQALRRAEPTRSASLPAELSQALLGQLRQAFDAVDGDLRVVLMTSVDLRRYVRQLLVRNDLEVPVLSYQDLTREFTLHTLRSITLPGSVPAALASPVDGALA
jgi:type III secretion protein V